MSKVNNKNILNWVYLYDLMSILTYGSGWLGLPAPSPKCQDHSASSSALPAAFPRCTRQSRQPRRRTSAPEFATGKNGDLSSTCHGHTTCIYTYYFISYLIPSYSIIFHHITESYCIKLYIIIYYITS